MSLSVAHLEDLLTIDGQSVALIGHQVVRLSELPTVLLQESARWHDVDSALQVVLAALGEPAAGIDARGVVEDAIRELLSHGLLEGA